MPFQRGQITIMRTITRDFIPASFPFLTYRNILLHFNHWTKTQRDSSGLQLHQQSQYQIIRWFGVGWRLMGRCRYIHTVGCYTYIFCGGWTSQVNLSPLSAAFMRQWIGSELVQIMAVAYSAQSRYLNQCRVIVNWNLMNKFQKNCDQNTKLSFTKMHLKIPSTKWWLFCPGGDELNRLSL